MLEPEGHLAAIYALLGRVGFGGIFVALLPWLAACLDIGRTAHAHGNSERIKLGVSAAINTLFHRVAPDGEMMKILRTAPG